ncbi:MAG: HAD-IB family phosphatase [Candidatus Yonathbacteria bacterium]|nr:HAD-IB family phosphatase [Candidatus Yonathbacteria bacterium]
MSKRKVAIFDVDGTIFRSSLLIELVEELIAREIFTKEVRDEYRAEHLLWLDRKGRYDEYINSVVDVFAEHIKGVYYGDVKDAADEVFERYKDRVYRYTRDLIRRLQKEDYYLLAISHSPKLIIDMFCDEWGFDKSYGTLYEIGAGDRFTGQRMEEHLIFNKGATARRAIEKEGLSFEGSVGIGDTESDIGFLEIVEQPICFNPNALLERQARLNGWKIVVERKDVVYEM